MKKQKKILWVLLSVLLVLVLIVAGLALWQRNNLQALYLYATTNEEQMAQLLEEKQHAHEENLRQQIELTVTAPSREQTDALISGGATAEEIKENLGLPQIETSEERAPTRDELINACMAELYACEVDLMAYLGTMYDEMLVQWKALPPQERTQAKKVELGTAALNRCYELEVEVDAQVQGILDKYKPRLEEIGSDTKIMDDLWIYYCDKKAAEKAYWMNKHM